ncbi:MAG: sigma-70 family RNA polymerase sigma factor [Planctomycetaceae bacterium]|nr:sigma-70 family RNA polymerase sigma factor [Planctomycetaceae bacterium]
MISRISKSTKQSRGQRNLELLKRYHGEKKPVQKLQIRNEIMELNLGLVHRMANKFSSNWQDEREYYSEGCLALMDAVEKFDPDRGFQFSTYATTCIRNRLYRLFRTRARQPSMVSLNQETYEPHETHEEDADVNSLDRSRAMAEMIVQELDERERELVELRFGLDPERKFRSYRQVAELVGLSKERVRQLIQKAILNIQSRLVMSPGETAPGQ